MLNLVYFSQDLDAAIKDLIAENNQKLLEKQQMRAVEAMLPGRLEIGIGTP